MKIRNLIKKYGSAAAVSTGLMVAASSASAAIPEAVGTAFTSASADITTLEGYVWPVIITAFSALVVIKLFKRFGSKI